MGSRGQGSTTAALQLLLLLPLTLPPFPLLLLPPRPCSCPCCGGRDVTTQHLCSHLSCHLFGQPPFMPTSPHSCLSCGSFRQALFVLTSPHLCFLLLVHACCCWLVLRLIATCSCLSPFICWSLCSFGFRSCPFGFGWACLGSFALICTPQPLICVCIKYMVSTYILNRLTFIPYIINLCKTIDWFLKWEGSEVRGESD